MEALAARLAALNLGNATCGRRFTDLPEGTNPLDHYFTEGVNDGGQPRWIHVDPRTEETSVLVFTSGAAPGNGYRNVRAGFGVAYKPSEVGDYGIGLALERMDGSNLTSNRAEMRAVIAAMTIRPWSEEGFSKLVVASDSEYLIKGICDWVGRLWLKNGWLTTQRTPVKNQDLWEMMLGCIERQRRAGVRVEFCYVRRNGNRKAHRLARRAADELQSGYGYQETVLSE